jgi:hypothetical protein
MPDFPIHTLPHARRSLAVLKQRYLAGRLAAEAFVLCDSVSTRRSLATKRAARLSRAEYSKEAHQVHADQAYPAIRIAT